MTKSRGIEKKFRNWKKIPGAKGWKQTSPRVWWHKSNMKWISISAVHDVSGENPKIKYGALVGYDVRLYYVDPYWKRWYVRPVEKYSKGLNKRSFKTVPDARKFVKNYIKKHP
jgi:hypothetical protein